MTLIPVNIHLRISTKLRQINSPMQIQGLFIAPAGKGNVCWLAAQGKGKCATGKSSGWLLTQGWLEGHLEE